MMASALSREELLKYYADEIKALEMQIAKAQKEPKSYDLRSGVRPVIPPKHTDGTHLTRITQAHHRVSEKKDEEVTTSNLDRRFSGVVQAPKKNQRKEVGSLNRMDNGSQDNSGHVSIGLFEDIEPDDLDEDEVIWSDQNMMMSTPYADWLKKGRNLKFTEFKGEKKF